MVGSQHPLYWDEHLKLSEATRKLLEFVARRQEAERMFDEEVDKVARLMCEEMGVNPDDVVRATYADIAMPGQVFHNPEDYISVRRRELMRPHAASALAGFRAVQRYFLVEKK